jgi:hypothetical protein
MTTVQTMNLETDFHPLFLPMANGKEGYKPQVFQRIRVFRSTASGIVQAPHEYLPEELPDTETFYSIFGGGTYELWAIQFPGGKQYARRTLNFEGPPKPMAPPAVTGAGGTNNAASQSFGAPAPPLAPGMPPLPPGTDPMIHLMLWMQMRDAERAETIRRDERERDARQRERDEQRTRDDRQQQMQFMTTLVTAMSGNRESIGDTLRGYAELTKANQPAQPSQTPTQVMKESLEMTKLIQDTAKNMQPDPPEEGVGKVISEILGAATPLLQMANAQANAAAAAPSVVDSVSKVLGAA